MAVTDNPSLVAVASSAALPIAAQPVLIQAGFSGQTDTYVAPTPLAILSGLEGARSLALVDSSNPLPVSTPADPFGANADSAATAGSTGSISAKLRYATAALGALVGALVSGGTDFMRTVLNVSIASTNTAVTGFSVGTHRAVAVALVDTGGNQITSLTGTSFPSTATLSNISTSTASATAAALNTSRKGLRIFNDSDNLMYLKFGTTASATSHTDQVDPKSSWIDKDGYTGRVDVILDGSTGTARVTELT